MKYIILMAAAVGTLVLFGSAAPNLPAAPVNLEVTDITDSSATITWGPSQPCCFNVENSAPDGTWTYISWRPSDDTRGAITYDVKKGGNLVATGINTPAWQFTDLRKTKIFRVCITAVNSNGQRSAPGCATVTR